MKISLLSLLGIGSIGAFAICDICRPAAAAERTAPVAAATDARHTPDADTSIVALRVEGMTCGGCAIATRRVLERLDGVTKVEVSYEHQRAVVTYEPERVAVESMIAAVRKLGYTVTVLPTSRFLQP